jgi:hypothetical protein
MLISESSLCDPLDAVIPFDVMSDDKMGTKHMSMKNYYRL